MENIIATEVFDHSNKTYLLDRINGSTTSTLIRITETVHDGTRRGQHVVEMDAAVLKRILRFMEVPSSSLPAVRSTTKRPILSGEQCATMEGAI